MPTRPILGAALMSDSFEANKAWVLDKQRDLEIQDFYDVDVIAGDWRPLADKIKRQLDGYTGRLGVHGPFYGFNIATPDHDVRKVVQKRLMQGLDICAVLGATQLVVHSPFTTWNHYNLDGRPGARETLISNTHLAMHEVVKRAENMGVVIVIENIEDNDARSRVDLVRSFNSDAVRVSLDTGHANYACGVTNGPPIDHHVHVAGDLLHHVHLQDTDGYADRHWHPGQGNIAWVPLFEALGSLSSHPRLILEVDDFMGVQTGWRYLAEHGLAI
jgi:sugar phosphate isomerase/epimerase